jgi:DNA-binding CsgD family transcriptional regulator
LRLLANERRETLQTLKSDDYKKILKFIYFVNEDYSDMPDRALFAMEEYLSYPLCVYTIFNRTADGTFYVEKISSCNIPRKGLDEYQESVYKTDLFFNRLSYFEQGKKNRYVFLIEDIATPQEFFATDYGKYLARVNTPRQAVILPSSGNKLPIHVLNVFKTKEDGEFTEAERQILNQIGEAFSFSVHKYKQFTATENILRLIGTARDEKDRIGVAVLDESGALVHSDSRFAAAMSELYSSGSVESGLAELIELCASKYGVNIREIIENFSMEERGCHFHFAPRRIANSEGAFRYMTVIVERARAPSGKAPRRLQEAACARYRLSPKEAEVIEWMLAGLDNASIAKEMSVNISTVKFHIKNIFSKTGANSRASVISKLMTRREN